MTPPGAGAGGAPVIDVVVPTVGRPSLVPLLERLVADRPSPTGAVIVVDDRRTPRAVWARPTACPTG